MSSRWPVAPDFMPFAEVGEVANRKQAREVQTFSAKFLVIKSEML